MKFRSRYTNTHLLIRIPNIFVTIRISFLSTFLLSLLYFKILCSSFSHLFLFVWKCCHYTWQYSISILMQLCIYRSFFRFYCRQYKLKFLHRYNSYSYRLYHCSPALKLLDSLFIFSFRLCAFFCPKLFLIAFIFAPKRDETKNNAIFRLTLPLSLSRPLTNLHHSFIFSQFINIEIRNWFFYLISPQFQWSPISFLMFIIQFFFQFQYILFFLFLPLKITSNV